MVKQVRIGKTYLWNGFRVTAVTKKQNPWTPTTLVVRHENGLLQEVFFNSFKSIATGGLR